MEDDYYERIGKAILTAIAILIIASWLMGCKSQERVVTVHSHSTDTLIQTKVERDSIYAHDSIYVRDRGDTVWIERWHTRWRERLLADTVYVAKCDTLTRTETITKYREKELSWWQKTRLWIGNVVLIALFVAAAFFVWRIIGKFKN
jgi:Mg2+/citrate symporter